MRNPSEEVPMTLARSVLVLSLVAAVSLGADEGTAFFRNPALSATTIVFEYGGDLWSVPRSGGQASRLTTGPGEETNPFFSPDGSMVAFSGRYDGNVDVFVVPASGGVPRRLTWHPGLDAVQGWTRDGKRVLFGSGRSAAPAGYQQLFTIGLNGGAEQRLPLPIGYEGAFSPDGGRIAYVPVQRAFAMWKRYRGGRTTPIWLADLATSRVERVPRDNSNDFRPMWAAGKVWFLSDREGPVTLFSYDPGTKRVARAIENRGMDFKSASAAGDAIVIEQFGGLHLYDLKSGRLDALTISVTGDLEELRERFVKIGTRLINASISPSGVRAVFEGRGEIITVPEDKGDARNLTNTPGVMERSPAWSPDGTSVAYFSDESGEYALHIAPQDGRSAPRKIALAESTIYRSPRWSPDSKKLAFMDVHLSLWYVDLDAGKPIKVAKDRYFGLPDLGASWSPDSKWLAYASRLDNYMSAVHVYSLTEGRSTQVTDGMSDAGDPVWDRSGKYLFFTASTDSGSSLQPDIQAMTRAATSSIYLIVLDKDDPSPLAPQSDEEAPADRSKADAAKPAAGAAPPKGPDAAPTPGPSPTVVTIDFDNILQRVLALPMPPRAYTTLQTGKAGTLLALEAPPIAPGTPGPGFTVHRFDLQQRRADTPLNGVRFFQLAHNGEKMLYAQGQGETTRWMIGTLRPLPPAGAGGPPGPPPGEGGAKTLQTADLEVKINPRLEWPQMFRDAWRIQREMFYDPGLHGVNLADVMGRYERFVNRLSSRSDLTYLFQEMMGEMTVGHLGAGGGEQPEVRTIQTGLLGADYEVAGNRYRFRRIYNGENWNPTLRAPLTEPGVNVATGDYLLAVDGRDVTTASSVYSFFEARAGKQVALRVGPNANGDGARTVTVVPVPSESGLRTFAWVEDNRRKVSQMTGGRVAYIYMPDTSFGGYTNFNRYFYAQVNKSAAIIDERFNGGGMLATDIVETLSRKPLSRVATRDGEDELQPQGAIFGPKVMIINEFAGSGGDAMPWYFRRAGVGPLVGKRTWGGLVGRAGAPPLMDGGFVSSPSSAVWDPSQSKWIAENVGIEPDVEIENDPEAVRQGKDPQLEKAVEIVMAELAKTPRPQIKRPAFPNYQRPGGPPTGDTANAVRK
jgi:tricorn protease